MYQLFKLKADLHHVIKRGDVGKQKPQYDKVAVT
jgi:hypothetical protein